MENQPSHDELRRTRSHELRMELTRRGLPRAYINRLVSELDDHLLDLLEERNSPMGAARKLQPELEQDSEQRLGEPTQLAIFAAEQYHSRTFWGRHPLVTYLFAPLPLLIVCWIGFAFALWGILWVVATTSQYAFRLSEDSFPPEEHLLLQGIMAGLFTWYAIVAPPLAAALLLCRTYRRNALNWRWPALGCGLLAIVAAMFTIQYGLVTEPHGNGTLMVGLNLHYDPKWIVLNFLPKFALAFGIGLLLIKRAQQKLERDNTDFPLPSGAG